MTGTGGILNQAETILPTEWGEFIFSAFTDDKGDYLPHLCLRHPEMDLNQPVWVRIHSECITGDVFHSLKCDCGEQLNSAMKILSEKKGILIYLRQEGRGIGIINKIKAYQHQEKGLNTIEANEALGLKADYRDYSAASQIMKSLGITKINLITNNPEKIKDLRKNDIEIVSRVPLIIEPNERNRDYLHTKKTSLGHFLK